MPLFHDLFEVDSFFACYPRMLPAIATVGYCASHSSAYDPFRVARTRKAARLSAIHAPPRSCPSIDGAQSAAQLFEDGVYPMRQSSRLCPVAYSPTLTAFVG